MNGSAPSIIDILIVIDAEGLVADYPPGTAASPTMIDKPLIYMMVRQGNADFGEGTDELKITARTEDTIRWREATLSLNGDYVAMLYDFFALRGADLISKPEPLVATVKAPLPNPANPLQPGTQAISNYFWTSTVLSPGETTYAFRFAVMDRHGAVQGYFAWDPFIKISD